MSTPTQKAEHFFRVAKNDFASTLSPGYGEGQIALETREGLIHLADGLSNLSAGLRATYMLLEEMKQSIDQIKAQQMRARP